MAARVPGAREHAQARGRGGVGRGKRRLTALAGGCVAEDEGPEARLREGADFASAEELAALTGEAQTRSVRRGVAERLADAVEREVWWLQATGELPGGLPWDRQPAWRVRLWEWLLEEQARVAAVERAMTAW